MVNESVQILVINSETMTLVYVDVHSAVSLQRNLFRNHWKPYMEPEFS
jgi:hypothetical protein